jgi:rubrerythrin
MQKDFSELTEQEVLALAVSLEEEDIRSYGDLAEVMRENYPGTARMFSAMAEEENGHRHRLLDLYREKFGDPHPADPSSGCKELSRAQIAMAVAPARPRKGACPGGADGGRE